MNGRRQTLTLLSLLLGLATSGHAQILSVAAGGTTYEAGTDPVLQVFTATPEFVPRLRPYAITSFNLDSGSAKPTVIGEALGHYLTGDGAALNLPEALDFTAVDRITMVACGTAFYACLAAKYWFEQLARLPVEVDIASEFRYREPPVPEGTLAIFLSQSGETADTLAALRYLEDKAKDLDTNKVETINVLKGDAAIKKYGDK